MFWRILRGKASVAAVGPTGDSRGAAARELVLSGWVLLEAAGGAVVVGLLAIALAVFFDPIRLFAAVFCGIAANRVGGGRAGWTLISVAAMGATLIIESFLAASQITWRFADALPRIIVGTCASLFWGWAGMRLYNFVDEARR